MNILDTRENLNAMVLLHDQQIKDLAAHLLELKRLVTPMMEFKREKPTTMGMEYAANFESAEKLLEKKEWVGLTEEEKYDCYLKIDVWSRCVEAIEAKLKEKNGG